MHPGVISLIHDSDYSSTLALDTESLAREGAARADRRANAVVLANHVVTVELEDAALATGLRKAPDRAGTIRVVTIGGIDLPFVDQTTQPDGTQLVPGGANLDRTALAALGRFIVAPMDSPGPAPEGDLVAPNSAAARRQGPRSRNV